MAAPIDSQPFVLTIDSYVQMLERQHAQLIGGLQELYRRTQNGDGWTGPRIDVGSHNQPLTHKLLEALGVLQPDEWEDTEVVDCAWQDNEEQGQDDLGWIYSGTGSPSTQAAFSPVIPTQTIFPRSTITTKRRTKLGPSFTPITQTLSMPPPLMTTFAHKEPESYNDAFSDQIPLSHLTSFPSSEQMNMSIDQAARPMMDWSLGVDALLGNLGSQEQSMQGC